MDPDKLVEGIKGVGAAAGKKGGQSGGGMGPQMAERITPPTGAAPNPPQGTAASPSHGSSSGNDGHGPEQAEKAEGNGKGGKSLSDRLTSGGGGGQQQNEAEGVGDRAKEEVKNAVKPSAQNIKDVSKSAKNIAEASADQGFNAAKEAKEVGEAYQEHGARGAAGAATRKTIGKGVQAGLEFVPGAQGPVAAAGGKVVEEGLKKENLIRAGLIILAPVILLGVLAFTFFFIVANPYKQVSNVLTKETNNSFTNQASGVLGPSMAAGAQALAKAGYVENKPGTAIAAPTTKPKPGSLLDKFSKINVNIAKYQTQSPDCPYKYTTKEVVNFSGQKTTVIDKVYNLQGQEVSNTNPVVLFCIMDSFPLNGIFIRTQDARDVNKFSGTHLNYAEPTSTTVLPGEGSAVNNSNPTGQGESSNNSSATNNLSSTEMDKFVYDKTYNNITSKADQNPKIDGDQNLTDYITKVRAALEKGDDPYNVDSNFQFAGPANNNDTTKIISTMCNFSKAYMEPENLRASINSRFNTGSRSGVKSATLADTRTGYGLSASELNATFQQLDNWAASRAYSQVVERNQTGEAINPESLSNTAYSAGYDDTMAILANIRDECVGKEEGGFLGFFTTNQRDEGQILADYKALQQIIVAQSNGKFTSPDDFGTQQLMINLIRSGGGSAVSGLEPGPWNFNNQSQGFRQLYSQYMLKIGGRFLTPDEDAQLAINNENTRRDIEEKQGIAYRLFNTNNVSSVASQLLARSPRTPKELGRESSRLAASFSNPLKSIADLQGSFSYIALGKSNQAFAAADFGNAYFRINTIAFPQKDAEGKDIFANSDEIQNMKENGTEDQKKLLGYYEGCTKMDIPSKAYFIPQFAVNNGVVNKNQIVYDITGGPKPDNGAIGIHALPIFPAMEDKIEYTDRARDNTNFSQQEKDANYQPKEEKKAWMACLIMLQPTRKPDDGSLLYITDDMSQFLFNMSVKDAGVIASKYRLYLYSNTLVDNMVQLSSTERDTSIYANPSGSGSGSGGSSGLSGAGLIWPVDPKGTIVQCFMQDGVHPGMDIGAPQGTNVIAPADGKVEYGTPNPDGYGPYYFLLNHGGGVWTLYGHVLDRPPEGTLVKQGDIISHVGSLGYSTGPHLHFETRNAAYSGFGNASNPTILNPMDALNPSSLPEGAAAKCPKGKPPGSGATST